MKPRKLCANCKHCKIGLITTTQIDGRNLREGQTGVRCALGHWKTRKGREKQYQICFLSRRKAEGCVDYLPMGKPLSLAAVEAIGREWEQQS